MKNKHALDPNGATFAATQPRGRGRPKTGADGQRIDPTSDLYMKQDGRYGENPICPTSHYDEVCISIFGTESKYKGDPNNHPLKEPLFKFSHNLTPGIADTKPDANQESDLHKDFRDKTTEMI